MRYDLEWDPVKAKQNFRKHQVSFERAATLFHDPAMISMFDDTHSADEDRWVTIGRDEHGIVLVVCHTFQKIEETVCVVRMISARKATKYERQQYEEETL